MVTIPQGTPLDEYTILRVLGEGGFGITYLAEDKALRRHFAIKEYFPQSWASRESDDSISISVNSSSAKDYAWGLERFLEEARTLAKFRHPAIVQVTRIFEANNTAYMVLEYEDGQNFGEWLKSREHAPTQEELDGVLPPLLSALALIHSNGILHRDIAPDNIYIRKDGTPVLLDFGSAREAIGQRTKTLSAVVKSGYSPQEQYTTQGKDQGPWTDIYSLGATLYKAVTGEAPPEATQRAIQEDYESVTKHAKGEYRKDFLKAIDHALERHHTRRPRSVEDWQKQLLEIPTPDPVPGTVTQQPGWKRWAAILLLGAGLGAGAYSLGFIGPDVPGQSEQALALNAFTSAEAHFNAKRHDEALKDLNRAIKLNPAYARAYMLRGRTYIAKDNPGRALSDLDQAIRLGDKRAQTYNSRGVARYRLKDYAEAKNDFDKAVSLNAENGLYFHNRGNTEEKLKRYDSALKDFRTASGLEPKNEKYKQSVARLEKRTGSGSSGKDKKDGKGSGTSKLTIPFSAKPSYNSALKHFVDKNYDAAIKDLTTAILLSPSYAKAYTLRGRSYLRKQEYKKALGDLDKAIELGDKSGTAYNARGVVHSDQKDFARAKDDFDTAISLDPKRAFFYYNRGVALVGLKRYEAALEDYRKAAGLKPDDDRIAKEIAKLEKRLGVKQKGALKDLPKEGPKGLDFSILDKDKKKDTAAEKSPAPRLEEFLKNNLPGTPNLTDAEAWKLAQQADTIEAYQNYRRNYPLGFHTREATQRVLQLRLRNAAQRRGLTPTQ